ncbi:glycosyltransferase family 9 protein [Candidatus Neptunochlamydia vexilliferae]|uniref:glycosyltransferase family 9 protein n=1 Tax=Candidatus Neptunichlamydia vexilliferae TaxID=1651774 RepID=UPI001890BF1D|nr:glycosyltransferase family 9 protein [Candidatus Neptunochlamydia vexilliferae]
MKAAVICSKGMGDGLMMLVASHRLKLQGYHVTTFQDSLGQLAEWFPGHHFAKRSEIESLDDFDLILLQNDNTPFSFNLVDKYRDKMSIFYASYEEGKHRPLTPRDFLFNRARPMVYNIAEGVANLLGQINPIQENGLMIPEGLTYQKYGKRIVIHPTSTTPKRTWHRGKFLKLAAQLKKKGYEVVFAVSPEEREEWVSSGFPVPKFPTLADLAAYLYESRLLIGNESGTGHLASNLGIPTLIVASCPKQMALWRPGFRLGKVLTPPPYIPNFKLARLREKKWQTFITPHRMFKTCRELLEF